MKNQKGITLISLIVTLLTLIILSSIVVKSNVGDSGLITQTVKMSKTSFDDNVRDALMALQIQYTSKSEFMQFLKDEQYIKSNNVIDVFKLLETESCDYGIGQDIKDVYVLTDNMDLIYYDENNTDETLCNIGIDMEP